jgi:hypothetical protein
MSSETIDKILREILHATCRSNAIYDDYCATIAKIEGISPFDVQKRVDEKTAEYLMKMKEKYPFPKSPSEE